PMYWAHRGGSANWSEMTLYAYRNAVAYGAKCLELSARRTSDGVWVGCHDATLDRVTALAGNVDTYTWEQLDGISVDAPSTGGQLARLEDFLAEFTDQVLLIDPKSNGWGPIQMF